MEGMEKKGPAFRVGAFVDEEVKDFLSLSVWPAREGGEVITAQIRERMGDGSWQTKTKITAFRGADGKWRRMK